MNEEPFTLLDFDDLPTIPALTAPLQNKTPQRRRLSAILQDIPATEAHLIVEQFIPALLEGTVRAVPILDRKFTKTVIDGSGQKVRQVIQDELVEVDEAFTAWLTATRRAARYQVLAHVGKIGTTEERLASGHDDFGEMLLARLARLRAEQPRKGRRG